MSDQNFNEEPKPAPIRHNKNGEPELVFPVPKGMVYGSVAVIIFSLLITFFVRNPYTQASTEGGMYYERSMETNMALWVFIFIVIPASFLAYKHWLLPMLERRKSQGR